MMARLRLLRLFLIILRLFRNFRINWLRRVRPRIACWVCAGRGIRSAHGLPAFVSLRRCGYMMTRLKVFCPTQKLSEQKENGSGQQTQPPEMNSGSALVHDCLFFLVFLLHLRSVDGSFVGPRDEILYLTLMGQGVSHEFFCAFHALLQFGDTFAGITVRHIRCPKALSCRMLRLSADPLLARSSKQRFFNSFPSVVPLPFSS